MRQVIFLSACVFLVSFFSVAEGKEIKIDKDRCNSKGIVSLEALKLNAHQNRFNHLFLMSKQGSSKPVLKSAVAVKQKLDSLVIKVWNENSTLKIPEITEKFTYDSRGNVTQFDTYEEWDNASGKWGSIYRDVYTYNGDNQLLENTHSEWNSIGSEWFSYSKMVNSYDASGNLEQSIEYEVGEGSGTWAKSLKRTYETVSNANGKVVTELMYEYDETISDWEYFMQNVSTFNANGKLMLEKGIFQIEEQIIEFSKTEYIYDEKENLIRMTAFGLDFETGLLKKNMELIHSYNTMNRRIMTTSSELNEETMVFGKSTKLDFLFDDNGNLVEQIEYDWDMENNLWMKSWKQMFNYNNAYSLADLHIPDVAFGTSDYFFHMMTNTVGSNWDEDANKYVEAEFGNVYYSEQNFTSIHKNTVKDVNVYPNPVSDKLSFRFTDSNKPFIFELFDMQGRKIMHKAIESGGNISLRDLEEGMYLYRLDFGTTQQNGKLLKE